MLVEIVDVELRPHRCGPGGYQTGYHWVVKYKIDDNAYTIEDKERHMNEKNVFSSIRRQIKEREKKAKRQKKIKARRQRMYDMKGQNKKI